jgi:hypothetical protein
MSAAGGSAFRVNPVRNYESTESSVDGFLFASLRVAWANHCGIRPRTAALLPARPSGALNGAQLV